MLALLAPILVLVILALLLMLLILHDPNPRLIPGIALLLKIRLALAPMLTPLRLVAPSSCPNVNSANRRDTIKASALSSSR